MERNIIASLKFDQMTMRYSTIPDAYPNTFEWIFSPSDSPNEGQPATTFRQWLEKDNKSGGMFCVSGKAGSGKSTLMKYLCRHHQVIDGLAAWAGSGRIVIANFFFWQTGSPLQNSQEGLLRTLLLEVFRNCPQIISKIVPHRWGIDQDEWTSSELMEAVSVLQHDFEPPTRFCFFIDGLDEFAGDPQDLLEVLSRITVSRNVKVCVSSRPWPIFQEGFEDSDRILHLHHLTHHDIVKYAWGKLKGTPSVLQADIWTVDLQALVDEIVQKAQGVFQWVYLVVRSTLRGFSNEDSFATLQARLRLLDTDLEALFQRMLNSGMLMTNSFQV
jgi:energy-coupling factor transporter ATP-binding protein EcfA2